MTEHKAHDTGHPAVALLRIARLLVESWNRRDAQAFAGLFTPAAEYVTGAGERVTGRQAIAQLLETATPAPQVCVVGRPIVECDGKLGRLSFRWATVEAAGVGRHGRITCRCSPHESGWRIEALHNDEAGSVKDGLYVSLGGQLVDLQSGMLDAVRHPPEGFVSRGTFNPTDVEGRLRSLSWFTACGNGPVALDITPEVVWVADWEEAAAADAQPEWEEAALEAQNQLTLWLHNNAPDAYGRWNEHVQRFKANLLASLEPIWRVYQQAHGLDDWFVHSLQWNVLGAAMANEYLSLGHQSFFFLELLRVYEAGRFPCGWKGTWPKGRLVVH